LYFKDSTNTGGKTCNAAYYEDGRMTTCTIPIKLSAAVVIDTVNIISVSIFETSSFQERWMGETASGPT